MTPAEELLAAIKEHATADVSFEFRPAWPKLHVCGRDADVAVMRSGVDGLWNEVLYGRSGHTVSLHAHDSASSAVYSAFLRARK